jgi:hypothetical protein
VRLLRADSLDVCHVTSLCKSVPDLWA